MTKYRFTRGQDGTVIIRAERVLGKQLVANITRVLAPGEDVSAAMKQLHKEVHQAPLNRPVVEARASERRVVE